MKSNQIMAFDRARGATAIVVSGLAKSLSAPSLSSFGRQVAGTEKAEISAMAPAPLARYCLLLAASDVPWVIPTLFGDITKGPVLA